MAIAVCTINMKLGAESEAARLGRLYMSLDNSVPSFCLWRNERWKRELQEWFETRGGA